MSLTAIPVKQGTWMTFPRPGFDHVSVKMLLGLEGELRVSMLKIGPGGGIPSHQDKAEIEVICIEGNGFASVGDESVPLSSGERVTWPANVDHRLWTTDNEMVTLMIEKRYANKEGSHQVEA